ncbi:MAG TPA: choice-of-anchor L domain-containing protein, partial [Chitinophagales bacterium]|nr:choice-of-anchor L domain-containing protein [Chitinophagales bacterium]
NFTYDACILEFDVMPQGESLLFEYIFGSEEYNEYVNSEYNDVFAFYISGPGIAGQQNIALVPGTNVPVAINNVNCGSYGQYYVCNDWWTPTSGGCFTECPTESDLWDPEYDGLTTVMTAVATVQPGQTYHLKLAIADVGDGAFDSGVFIRAGSLNSPSAVLTFPDTAICAGQSATLAVAGAPATATYTWTPATGLSCTDCPNPVATPESTTTYSVTVSDGGVELDNGEVIVTVGGLQTDITTNDATCNTASGSVEVVVSGGATPITYTWENGSNAASLDSVTSGSYSVTVTDVNGCSAVDTATVGVSDGPVIVFVATDPQCDQNNGSIDASITGGASPYQLQWNTGDTTEDLADLSVGLYSVTVTDASGCSVMDTVSLGSGLVGPNLGDSIVICSGDTFEINAGISASSYQWSTGETGESIFVSNDGTYAVTVVVDGCELSDTVSVVTTAPFTVDLGNDTVVCSGTPVGLDAGITNAAYLWSTGDVTQTIAFTQSPDMVWVQVAKGYCVASDTISILDTICLPDDFVCLFVPNAFSPNNDGRNDNFQVIHCGIENFEMNVYNRWGNLVYQSNDPDDGWDGTLRKEPQ